MSDLLDVSGKVPTEPGSKPFSITPQTASGWWALGLVVVAVASWIVLPVITMVFRDTYPIVDTWVMPAIGTVLVDLAAVLSVWSVWRKRERSVLNIVALALVVSAALFITFMVVGEGIAGAFPS